MEDELRILNFVAARLLLKTKGERLIEKVHCLAALKQKSTFKTEESLSALRGKKKILAGFIGLTRFLLIKLSR